MVPEKLEKWPLKSEKEKELVGHALTSCHAP